MSFQFQPGINRYYYRDHNENKVYKACFVLSFHRDTLLFEVFYKCIYINISIFRFNFHIVNLMENKYLLTYLLRD